MLNGMQVHFQLVIQIVVGRQVNSLFVKSNALRPSCVQEWIGESGLCNE